MGGNEIIKASLHHMVTGLIKTHSLAQIYLVCYLFDTLLQKLVHILSRESRISSYLVLIFSSHPGETGTE